jgi:hypothetical protein
LLFDGPIGFPGAVPEKLGKGLQGFFAGVKFEEAFFGDGELHCGKVLFSAQDVI